MSKVALSLSTASLLVLAACQTTGNKDYWSDWEAVPKSETVLDWNFSKPTDVLTRRVSHSGTRQEQWSWDDGTVFVTKAGFARHYRIKVDENEFSKHLSEWDSFGKHSPSLSVSDIQETTNRHGRFYFTELKNNDGDDCWVFMQAVKGVVAANYIDSGHPTGFLMGYDCGASRYSSTDFNQFAAGLRYR
ncbi:hypothetical protein WH96_02645 [Kiloniella spongiae]|uniref:Lipoprotein n=1 Tax=Kiloniella spongiae TaxID=1489064 RepID=A0A0H2MIR6_9PROT|nr:hypothetical protein [Kiloniella spongiae]KLN62419.1 hypothetical protein WH96_02645 [Kiloniella spongiae]